MWPNTSFSNFYKINYIFIQMMPFYMGYAKMLKKYRVERRWFLVALSTFFIDLIVFSIISKCVPIWIANIFSQIFANLYNFYMHKRFTFNDKSWHVKNIFNYLVSLMISYLFTTSLIYVLVRTNFARDTSKVFSQFLFAPINYLLLKNFVFNTWEKKYRIR